MAGRATIRHREWRKRNPEGAKLEQLRHNLRRQHGLSLEEYEAMVDAQGGVCAICKRECDRFPRLSVDHDHVTGRNRGALCSRCNHLLGNARDSEQILHAAIAYLSRTMP